jgi:predicted DNA-binding protein
MSTTIRVSDETHTRLARLAARTGRPMTQLLSDAAETLERELFFNDLTLGYARLRSDPDGWRQVEVERSGEATALGDGAE